MTTKGHPTHRKFRLTAFLSIWHILGLTVLHNKVMVILSSEWVFEHKRVFLTLCWTLQTNPGRGGECEWTRHLYSVLSLSPGLLGWLSTQLWLRCSWCLMASMQHTEGRLFLVNSSQLVRTTLVSECGGTSSTSGGKARAGTACRVLRFLYLVIPSKAHSRVSGHEILFTKLFEPTFSILLKVFAQQLSDLLWLRRSACPRQTLKCLCSFAFRE